MHVAGLWRYPVKSLAGEGLDHAHLNLDGIIGDRVVHVAGIRTAHRAHPPRPGAFHASTGPDGVPLVAGHPWDTPAAAPSSAVAGPHARLVAYRGPERFDVLNLLVATDGAVDAFGHDIRRLRPNLLLGGVPVDAEQTGPARVAIGDALIGVHSVRQRCVVTSVDPDTGATDPESFAVSGAVRRKTRPQLLGHPTRHHPPRRRRRPLATDQRPAHIGGWITGAPYTAS